MSAAGVQTAAAPNFDAVDCRGRRAFVTGVTGQDGSYLAELLLAKGYAVDAMVRRASASNTARIAGLPAGPARDGEPVAGRLTLHEGDLCDGGRVAELVDRCEPDEIYHLAAQTHVRASFDSPVYTHDVVALGTVRVLEAARRLDARRRKGDPAARGVRVYQAGSSEVFGAADRCPQDESTPFRPRNPYAVAKASAFYSARNYRDAYGLFAATGILFNHESPRRGEEFVTRKITRAAGRIAAGAQDSLSLGTLDARRDWGFAPEYVETMWRTLQTDAPHDLVIATGADHSVREFLDAAFAAAGLDPADHVETDPRLRRPAEVHVARGDASGAARVLDWRPRTDFRGLVRAMVEHDLALARREAAAR